LALWALLAVRKAGQAQLPHQEEEERLSMLEGLRLIASNRLVLLLMAQTAVVVIFMKRFDPLLPAFAEEGLGNTDITGLLKLGMLVGAIAAWLGTSYLSNSEVHRQWSYRLLVVLPLVLICFAATGHEYVAAGALALVSTILLAQESCNVAAL